MGNTESTKSHASLLYSKVQMSDCVLKMNTDRGHTLEFGSGSFELDATGVTSVPLSWLYFLTTMTLPVRTELLATAEAVDLRSEGVERNIAWGTEQGALRIRFWPCYCIEEEGRHRRRVANPNPKLTSDISNGR